MARFVPCCLSLWASPLSAVPMPSCCNGLVMTTLVRNNFQDEQRQSKIETPSVFSCPARMERVSLQEDYYANFALRC